MAKQYFYLQGVEVALDDLRDADIGGNYAQQKARDRIIQAIMGVLSPVQCQMVEGGDGPTLWDARLMALQVINKCRLPRWEWEWALDIPLALGDAMDDWYAAWQELPDWRKWPDEFLPPCVTCGKTVSDKAHREGWRLCDDCLRQAHEDRRAEVKLEEQAVGFYACYKD